MDTIRQDALTQAVMESREAMRGLYSKPRAVLFAVQSDEWRQQLDDARWLDAYASAHHGQRDLTHHFCAVLRQQQTAGFVVLEVTENIHGWCVRDTMIDGLGVLFGGRSLPGTTYAEAVEWARRWHAERPTHREVVAGFARSGGAS